MSGEVFFCILHYSNQNNLKGWRLRQKINLAAICYLPFGKNFE